MAVLPALLTVMATLTTSPATASLDGISSATTRLVRAGMSGTTACHSMSKARSGASAGGMPWPAFSAPRELVDEPAQVKAL